MTHVICRLTAKNRDQLRNPTLGNRVWAAFTIFLLQTGYTALHLAAANGYSSIVADLIAYGSNVDAINQVQPASYTR